MERKKNPIKIVRMKTRKRRILKKRKAMSFIDVFKNMVDTLIRHMHDILNSIRGYFQ